MNELIKIWQKLKDAIERATVENATLKNALGVKTKNIVVERTRSGKGINFKNKQEIQLDPHKPAYVRERRFLQRKGKLSATTSPTTSNLTKSGDLVNDVKHAITDKGALVYVETPKSKIKLKEQEKGEMMKLSVKEEQALARTVAAAIVSELRKLK